MALVRTLLVSEEAAKIKFFSSLAVFSKQQQSGWHPFLRELSCAGGAQQGTGGAY